MISGDVIRGYVDIMILYFLLDEPNYAYEISKRIRAQTMEKYILRETTLYSALNRLERDGYVTSYHDDSSGKKRTYYQVTPEGRNYYQAKSEEWVLTKDVIERFIR